MIRKKIIGIVAIATISATIFIGAHSNNVINKITPQHNNSINSELLSGPVNYSDRLANYVGSAANRKAAWQEAMSLHNGSQMNNCTLWVSSCLRGSGVPVPNSTSYTTYLAKWLIQHDWQQKYNMNSLRRGDICFASNKHAFIFLSWHNKSKHLANVVDEQAAFFTPNAPSYVRNLDGTHGNGWVPGDSKANDTYSAATYYMSNYPTGQAISTNQTGWKSYEGNWYYNFSDNSLATGWQDINGTWYYFNANAAMQTGWQEIGGTWYHLDSSGALETGWQVINGSWYYFNTSGAMITGWQDINGTWYFFNPSGSMNTGWQCVKNTWYYFNTSGGMETGWQYLDNTWYYFNTSGQMSTDWQYLDGTWYYFNASGYMQTNWQDINGSWYYFTGSGNMITGTHTIKGTKYSFNNSGQVLNK